MIVYRHPFLSDKEILDADPGSTVADVVNGLGSKFPLRVILDGDNVPQKEWPFTPVLDESHLVVRAVPAGVATEGIERIGRGVSEIVWGSILTVLTVGHYGPQFVLKGISDVFGGTYQVGQAIGALTGAGAETPSPISRPDLRGGSNAANPLGKPALILGKHLVTPNYAAKPYTELGTVFAPGDNLYLNMLFCVGYGPLRLTDMKIGDRLLAGNASASTTVPYDGSISIDGYYADVDLEVAQPVSLSGADVALPALYPKVVQEEQLGYALADFIDIRPTFTLTAANVTVEVNASAKTFTFTLTEGNLFDRGMAIGNLVKFEGFANSGNNNAFEITNVAASVLTCANATGLVNETLSVKAYTIPANIAELAKNTTKARVLVVFSQGLIKYDEDAVAAVHNVKIVPYYREKGTVTWTEFATNWNAATTATKWEIEGKFDRTVRFYAEHDGLDASKTYEVRVARLTPLSDPGTGAYKTFYETSSLMCVQSFTDQDVVSKDARKYLTLVAMRLKASGQLNGTVDKFNLIAESMTPIAPYNTASLSTSRNPADHYKWLLKGPYNPRPVTDDTKIDYTGIAAMAARNWTCDLVMSEAQTMRDACNRVLSTARASVSLRDGLYSLVEDVANTVVTQVVTPRNSWDFSGVKVFDETTHGVKVTFINAATGYTPDERVVLDDAYLYDFQGGAVESLQNTWGNTHLVGDAVCDDTDTPIPGAGTYSKATVFEKVNGDGLTDPDSAWKLGRYLLATKRLRPESFSVSMDAEQLVATRGDRVQVTHDAPMWGALWGRIKSLTLDMALDVVGIVLDDYMPAEAGKTYAVRIRTTQDYPNNTLIRTTTIAAAGSYNTLVFTAAIAAANAPEVGDLVQFGELNLESVACIVTGVEMNDDLSARLSLVEYNDGVYTADSGTIPAFDSKITKVQVSSPGAILAQVMKQVTNDNTSPLATGMGNLIETTLPAIVDARTPAIVASNAPRYLGRYDATHPATYNDGDWWTVYDTNDSPIQRGVWYSNAGTPARITTASSASLQGKFAEALTDVAWAEAQGTYGVASDYGIQTLFQSLGVVTAFINSLFTREITLQTGGKITSTNFDATNGFEINEDGTATFNEVAVRGDIRGSLDVSEIVLSSVSSGSTVVFADDVEFTFLLTSLFGTDRKWVKFPCGGTITVDFEAKSSSAGVKTRIAIYAKNNTPGKGGTFTEGTEYTLTTSYQTFSQSFTIEAGGFVSWRVTSGTPGYTAYVKNFRIKTNGASPGIIEPLCQIGYAS